MLVMPVVMAVAGAVGELSSQTLTYAEARATARENHPAVLAARLGARASHERAKSSGACDDPMVGFSLYQLPLDNMEGALQPGLSAQQRGMTFIRGPGMVPVMVMASQTFPWPGKRSAERAEANAMAQQQVAMTESVLADLDRALAYSLAEALAAQQSLEVINDNATLLDAMVLIADARLATGQGGQAEALTARSERDGLARDRLDLLQQQRMAQARLASLLGLDNPGSVPPVGEQVSLLTVPPRDVMLANAIDFRPELAGARAAVKATQARSHRAALEVLPDVTVNASYMFQAEGPGMAMMMNKNPASALLGPADMVTVGVSVPLPVFAPWKQTRQANAARLEHQRAQQEVEALARVVQSDIDEATANLETAHAEYDLHDQKLIPLAEQNVHAAQAAYEVGQGNLQLFLEAVRSVRNHHLEREVARVRYARALADLQRLTGMDLVRFERVKNPPHKDTP